MKEQNKSKRVLLLMTPTTYRATDFLKAAKVLGFEIVVGTNEAQALAGLAQENNLTLPFDHSDGALLIVREYVKNHAVTAVIGVDDEATIVASEIADSLGLQHNSLAATSATRNKLQMRKLFQEEGLFSPRFFLWEGKVDDVRFPCVVKPLSLSASRGVIRANNVTELQNAIARVKHLLAQPEVEERSKGLGEKQILIEDFIPGEEFALEGLLIRGKLKVLALFDKPDLLEGPYFEETIYVTPSRQPSQVQQTIFKCASRGCRALGLTEGPIHAEFRLNDRGVWILEIAARTIGGLCSRTLRFGTGMSLEEVILRHACGLEIPTTEREPKASGVIMLPIPKGGILREVRGVKDAKEVPFIEEVTISIPVGQPVVPLPEGNKYLGFIFARADTPDKVEGALRNAHQKLDFLIS